MMIIVSLLALSLLVALIESFYRYTHVEQHALRAMSDVQISACERIIDRGTGLPWICRRAVGSGECPCLPCEKLERELDRMRLSSA
jgi:hypothetical protein